jgi:hypothetical protein
MRAFLFICLPPSLLPLLSGEGDLFCIGVKNKTNQSSDKNLKWEIKQFGNGILDSTEGSGFCPKSFFSFLHHCVS